MSLDLRSNINVRRRGVCVEAAELASSGSAGTKRSNVVAKKIPKTCALQTKGKLKNGEFEDKMQHNHNISQDISAA